MRKNVVFLAIVIFMILVGTAYIALNKTDATVDKTNTITDKVTNDKTDETIISTDNTNLTEETSIILSDSKTSPTVLETTKTPPKSINCAEREFWNSPECSSGSSETFTPIMTSTTTVIPNKQQIPEFPTVALPLAGIIVMVYMLRKK